MEGGGMTEEEKLEEGKTWGQKERVDLRGVE